MNEEQRDRGGYPPVTGRRLAAVSGEPEGEAPVVVTEPGQPVMPPKDGEQEPDEGEGWRPV